MEKHLQLINKNLYKDHLPDLWKLVEVEKITHLDISKNKFAGEIIIPNLTTLVFLNLSDNQGIISSLILKDELPNLRFLMASGSNIEVINISATLPLLEEIEIRNSKVKKISLDKIEHKKCLTHIDLRGNQLTDLYLFSEWIINNRFEFNRREYGNQLNTISVHGNPLSTPPMDTIIAGKEAVIEYFKLLKSELDAGIDSYQCNDIKIVLMGNSTAGKSTLKKIWDGNKSDIDTTHWLEIAEIKKEINTEFFNLLVYDFGGQDYYHETHKVYFTFDTLYILLWEIKTNVTEVLKTTIKKNGQEKEEPIQHFELRYWLECVNLFAKSTDAKQDNKESLSSPGISADTENITSIEESIENNDKPTPAKVLNKNDAPIILLQNKKGDDTTVFLDLAELDRDYPIFASHSLSLLTQKGYNQFDQHILPEAIENFSKNKKYPGIYGMIYEAIKADSDPNFILSDQELKDKIINILEGKKAEEDTKDSVKKALDQYIKWELNTESSLRSIKAFLKSKGTLLYFEEIKDKNFLKIKKLSEAFAKVLEGLDSSGIFSEIEAKKKLGIDHQRNIDSILEVMETFKIIIKRTDDTYLAPQYLPREKPALLSMFTDVIDQAVFRYSFKHYIHQNVVQEFYHLFYKDIMTSNDKGGAEHHMWRNGIILQRKVENEDRLSSTVLVEFRDYKHIYISMPMINLESQLLMEVKAHFDKLCSSYNISLQLPYGKGLFYDVSKIEEGIKEGHFYFQDTDKPEISLSVFYRYNKILPLKLKNQVKIFISYARENREQLEDIKSGLSMALRNGNIHGIWYDKMMVAGEAWHQTIQDQLDEANVVIVLVSRMFLDSSKDYIWEEEIPKFIKNKDKVVIPIILTSCQWREVKWLASMISGMQAIMYEGGPVFDDLRISKEVLINHTVNEIMKSIKKHLNV